MSAWILLDPVIYLVVVLWTFGLEILGQYSPLSQQGDLVETG